MLVIFSLLITSSSFAAENIPTPIPKDEFIFDGTILSYHYTPIIIDGINYFPLQSLSSILNTDIKKDEVTNYLSIKMDYLNIIVQVGSNLAFLNDDEYELAGPTLIRNNIVYLPLDFAYTATSDIITWDIDKNTAFFSPSKPNQATEEDISSISGTFDNKTSYLNTSSLSGKLMLVNKWNPLISEYIPNNLKSVLNEKHKFIVPAKSNNIMMENDALNFMSIMLKTAANEGCKDFVISSGYRNFNSQTFFFKNKISYYSRSLNLKDAQVKAATIVAPPGMSEHQTGLAIDMTTKSLMKTSEPLSEAFSNTAQGKWLNDNSWKFGYVIRYNVDKTKNTGITSEPWHLRYVGLPHSEIMKKNNFCLEEYLEYIKKTKYIKYKTITQKTYEIYYFNMLPPSENLKLVTDGKSFSDVSKYGKYGYILTKVS